MHSAGAEGGVEGRCAAAAGTVAEAPAATRVAVGGALAQAMECVGALVLSRELQQERRGE